MLRPLDIRVVGRSTPWKWSIQRDIKDATPPAQVTGVVYMEQAQLALPHTLHADCKGALLTRPASDLV